MQCPGCGTWYAKTQAFCACCGAILADGQNKARIGHYQLLEKIGQGGMGIVYRGYDEGLGRDVAIKVLHQHLLNDPRQVERFRREARLHGQLMHPNIVALLDVHEDDEVMALVLELVRGCTLKEYLNARGVPDWPEIRYVADGILTGLEAAHEQGVVHRDLKPSNVFLSDDGLVKLMDFGLAKPERAEDDITATGDTVGSYHYMAPELILGGEIGPRTDLYALGIVLYRMATGQLPFTTSGGGEFEIMEKQVRHDPVPPRKLNRHIPKPLAETITRLMAKEPEARPESCAEVRDMLAALGEARAPALPAREDGTRYASYAEIAAAFSPAQREASTPDAKGAAGQDHEEEVPEHTLLWDFQVASAEAPEEPPLDLRAPPRIERRTLDRLRQAIASIPPLPEVWRQVEALMNDPYAAPRDLARIIENDPVLTSRILQWSNSAAWLPSGGKPITDVALAITRTGMDAAHDLILQTLAPNIGDVGEDSGLEAQRVWFHSQAIASIARILADQAQVVDRKLAGTLGMLHDIGKLVILHIEDDDTLQRLRERIAAGAADLAAEWETLGYTHIDAGMMLALHWKLPRSIHRFIYFHHHPCWHKPDVWPMDVQPSIMLGHMAHLTLQALEQDDDGIWSQARRTHVPGTEQLLRHPLKLPLTDARLHAQLAQEVDRLKRLFPKLFPAEPATA